MRRTARTLLIAAAVALAAAALPANAQQGAPSIPAHVRAAADRVIASQIARDLDFLASDKLAGRNTPSPGFDAAAEYIADRLRRAGLKPGGDEGTFFQRYTMREATVDTENSYMEIPGARFRFGDGFVLRSFAGPLTGTYRMVYVGHGWTIAGKQIDPYAGLDVRGKIVVAHGPRAMPKGVDVRQIGRLTPGASSAVAEAARRGAAGVIFIPVAGAVENWTQMRAQNTRVRELEPRVPSAYAAQPSTSILLSASATAALLANETKGVDLNAKAAAGDYSAAFEFDKSVTLSITAAKDIAHRPHNVVTILEGTDPVLKHEYITVFSHLDGAVGTREVYGDAIYNSADDNASGSAGMLSVAEQMAAARPRRSIIFVWDSGEEQGLWGTRWFVANPPVPLDRIVAHFNVDMIGANRAPGSPDAGVDTVSGPNEVFLIGPGVLSARADALIERVNAAYLSMTFNRAYDRPDHEYFYPRTDAGPFLERGILTIGFTTGNHGRYHLPSDEARFLDPGKIESVSRTVFVSIWMLADQAARPSIDKAIPATVPRYR